MSAARIARPSLVIFAALAAARCGGTESLPTASPDGGGTDLGPTDVGVADAGWMPLPELFVDTEVWTNLISGCSDGKTARLDFGSFLGLEDSIAHLHRSYEIEGGRIRLAESSLYEEPAPPVREKDRGRSRRFCTEAGAPGAVVRTVYTATLAEPTVSAKPGPLGVTLRAFCKPTSGYDFENLLVSSAPLRPGVQATGCTSPCAPRLGATVFSRDERGFTERGYCTTQNRLEMDGARTIQTSLSLRRVHRTMPGAFVSTVTTVFTGTVAVEGPTRSYGYAILDPGSDALEPELILPYDDRAVTETFFVPFQHAFILERVVGFDDDGPLHAYSLVTREGGEQPLPSSWPTPPELALLGEPQLIGPGRIGFRSGPDVLVTNPALEVIDTVYAPGHNLILWVEDEYLVFRRQAGGATSIAIERIPASR